MGNRTQVGESKMKTFRVAERLVILWTEMRFERILSDSFGVNLFILCSIYYLHCFMSFWFIFVWFSVIETLS